jgi:hypothetical protein
MTTGLSYAGTVANTRSYKTQIATMAVVDETDPAFLEILPMAITYAENRIYREVDFLFTSISTTAYSCTIGTRTIAVPAGTFVVPEQINIITPSSVSDPNLGTRNPLLPTTKEFLDAVYGAAGSRGQPLYFAPFDDYTFLLGPYPDQTYTVELVGTYRPQSLGDGTSGTQTTTFISLYLPDLFIMASMIYVAAYQRNFSSAQGNDPAMPVTYETAYATLLKSALSEEGRKKFEAAAWSSQAISITATPTR